MASTALTNTWQDIKFAIASINDGLMVLSDAQVSSNAMLVTNVQALTKLIDLRFQSLESLLKGSAGTPESIPLNAADDLCIQYAFTFVRTLNEIESLVADSQFIEKNNNNELRKYRNAKNALHRNCIEILNKLKEEQLKPDEKVKFTDDFNALFGEITADLNDRAKRLVEIHDFRDRILHFFAQQCYDLPKESTTELTVTTS